MDYHSVHGHDVSSFDLPSTHRLPTVSAAQALEELDDESSSYVSTSLPDLDKLLAGSTSGVTDDEAQQGGVQKGQVTEIWGPPGVGKTTFGIQMAANTLRDGKSVVWVDGFHPVSYERFADLCSTALPRGKHTESSSGLEKLVHYTCPSLAHFIALTCRPTPLSVPPDTSLFVIDSLSALINHAFPRMPDSKAGGNGASGKGPSTSARRLQVLQYIIGALQKLAATRNVALVVLTQCATRMQVERGATLVPAITAHVWEQGIATRLALFKDWAWKDDQASGALLAAVQKDNGKLTVDSMDKLCAYKIASNGISAAKYHGDQPAISLSSTPAPKRKLRDTDFEIPDSDDDEDYGWEQEDAMPPMPSQWQGSEDILLGQRFESEAEDEDEVLDPESDVPENEEHPTADEE